MITNDQQSNPDHEKGQSQTTTSGEAADSRHRETPTKGRKDHGYHKKDRPNRYAPYERIAAAWHMFLRGPFPALGIGILSFVVLGIYTWFSSKQWRAMVQQADLMNKSLVESIRTREVENRAYITVVSVLPYRVHLAGKVLELGPWISAQAIIRNSGNTPAKNMRPPMWLAVTLDDKIKVNSLDWGPWEQNPAPETLAPNVDLPMGGVRQTTLREQAMLKQPGAKIVIRGKIQYWDFFDHEHWTEYCFVSDKLLDVWSQCEQGNRMD